MPLRPVTFREVVKKLNAAGFTKTTQRGSHLKFWERTATGTLTVIVPRHREIAAGTLRSIIRQANIPVSTFEKS
jgi:predicted RNA binding protein YcfA (HicA-like mRNA interferase family)